MKSYLVGGCVRDLLMGRKAADRDWVVTGSTEAEMLAKGYTRVGAGFPVFLHPETREEYALARRERKVAPGHRGFVCEFDPGVTIAEDLSRRDLTINAIALEIRGIYCEAVDPWGGQRDLEAKILRAVSPSSFADDPLRVLRLARFRAAFPDFSTDADTLDLARAAVPELGTLTPERVYAETCKALLSPRPSLYFVTLATCGALRSVFPEVADLLHSEEHPDHHPEGDSFEHTMLVLDAAVSGAADLSEPDRLLVLFAALLHDIGKGATPREEMPRHIGHEKVGAEVAAVVMDRLRAPSTTRNFACTATRQHMRAHRWRELRSATVLDILDAFGAIQDPHRFDLFLTVVDADKIGRGKPANVADLRQRGEFMRAARAAASACRGRDLIAAGVTPGPNPGQVGPRLREARIKAINRIRTEYGL